MTITPIEGVRYWFDQAQAAFVAPGRPNLPVVSARDQLVYGTYRPGAATTGVPNFAVLTAYNASSVDKVTIPDGAVITDKIIYGDITFAGAATLLRCSLVGGTQQITSGNTAVVNGTTTRTGIAVLIDCTIRPRTPSNGRDCVLGKQVELYRCDLSNGVDGIGLYSTSSAAPNVNAKVHGCWVHDLLYVYPDAITTSHTDGTHNDCVQIQGGKVIDLFGNFFDASSVALAGTGANPDKPDLLGQGYANGAAIIIQNNTGAGIDNTVTIRKNWLRGGLSQLNVKPNIAFSYRGNRHHRDTYTHGSPGAWSGYWIRFDDHTPVVDGITTGVLDNVWADGPYVDTVLAEPRDRGVQYNA